MGKGHRYIAASITKVWDFKDEACRTIGRGLTTSPNTLVESALGLPFLMLKACIGRLVCLDDLFDFVLCLLKVKMRRGVFKKHRSWLPDHPPWFFSFQHGQRAYLRIVREALLNQMVPSRTEAAVSWFFGARITGMAPSIPLQNAATLL